MKNCNIINKVNEVNIVNPYAPQAWLHHEQKFDNGAFTVKINYKEARELLLRHVKAIGTENVSLPDCYGRVIAEEIRAAGDIPPFDRSPYDGYALRSQDTSGASNENPVRLLLIEEIPAGGIAHKIITKGTAAKILTGAPIPRGADSVIMFEHTTFDRFDKFNKEDRTQGGSPDLWSGSVSDTVSGALSDTVSGTVSGTLSDRVLLDTVSDTLTGTLSDTVSGTVCIREPLKAGQNVIFKGEDTKEGTLLSEAGEKIDAGLAGTIAGQNKTVVSVYRIPKAGVISTGYELTEPGESLPEGHIYNSNRYSLSAALNFLGCQPVYLGTAGDNVDDIASLLLRGLNETDIIVLSGGVSVGDYDLTPLAMERIGADILFRGVDIKPGMACAYGIKDNKLICALSGNPASSLTNLHVIAAPAIKKLCGRKDFLPKAFTVKLLSSFRKKSPVTRFLRGKLEIRDGSAYMRLSGSQGNVILSSVIGSDMMALVPSGSGPLEEGASLEGFLI